MTEFIAGETMRQHMQQYAACVMPVGFVQMFTLDIVAALKYAHSKHVRHGDIKSDNVMLALPNRDVKLLDFGVAELISAEAGAAVDRSLVGTPNYMAPEFFDNSAVTYAADVWALGCLVCEMISGAAPYAGLHPCVVQYRQSSAPHPPLPPNASRELLEFLHACFVKSTVERATCERLLQLQFLREPAAWKSGQNLGDFGTKTQTFERDLEAADRQREVDETVGGADLDWIRRESGIHVSRGALVRSMAKKKNLRTPRSAAVTAAMAAAAPSSVAPSPARPTAATAAAAAAVSDDSPRLFVSRAGDRQFTTIGEALAKAEHGTLIVVEPGEYDERLTIGAGKKVAVMGAGKFNAVTIVCRDADGECVMQTGGQAVFDNVTFRSETGRSTAAVVVCGGTAKFRACEFVSASGSGLKVSGKTTSVTLSTSSIRGCARSGLLAEAGARVKLDDSCAVENNHTGINVNDAHVTLSDTQVHRNRATGLRLSFATASLGPNVSVAFNKRDGVCCDNTSLQLRDSLMRNNGRAALKLIGDVDGLVQQCSFDNNAVCVELVQATMIDFKSNRLHNNLAAIRAHESVVGTPLLRALGSAVRGNSFLAGTDRGICLYGTSDATAPAGFSELLASVAANNSWAPEVSDYIVCDARHLEEHDAAMEDAGVLQRRDSAKDGVAAAGAASTASAPSTPRPAALNRAPSGETPTPTSSKKSGRFQLKSPWSKKRKETAAPPPPPPTLAAILAAAAPPTDKENGASPRKKVVVKRHNSGEPLSPRRLAPTPPAQGARSPLMKRAQPHANEVPSTPPASMSSTEFVTTRSAKRSRPGER